MAMSPAQAQKIFDRHNPASAVVRAPNGRARMRTLLDEYARAVVNLYGVITKEEFVELFNAHHEDQTTVEEVFTLLLPQVLKSRRYGFYEDYIVHHAVLWRFDWVETEFRWTPKAKETRTTSSLFDCLRG